MESETRIRISIQNGELEISGSEAFVREQIESFKDLIVEALQKTKRAESGKPQTPIRTTLTTPENPGDFHPHVYAIADEKVSIIANIPGDSIPKRTVNTALLYLYAKVMVLNQEEVPLDEIKEVCRSHGFYDSKQFTSHLKAAKPYFVIKGSRKNYSARMTVPGRQQAEQLLASIEDINASA
ncbi:MAG: hypothetical protein AB1564_02560 [Chloroflexota bacterium]